MRATLARLGFAEIWVVPNLDATFDFSINGKFTPGPRIIPRQLWLRSTWGLDGLSRYDYSTDGKTFTAFGQSYQLGWGDYRGDRIGIFGRVKVTGDP